MYLFYLLLIVWVSPREICLRTHVSLLLFLLYVSGLRTLKLVFIYFICLIENDSVAQTREFITN